MSDTVQFVVVENNLKDAPTLYQKHCRQAVGQTMEYVEQEAKTNTPSKRAAGAAGGRGGIVHRVEENAGIIEGILSGTARNSETGFNYLAALEWGTGIHSIRFEKKMITPKKKKFLAWVDPPYPRPTTAAGWKEAKKAKVAHFLRQVEGQKPKETLKKAMQAGQKKFKELYDREMEKMNRRTS